VVNRSAGFSRHGGTVSPTSKSAEPTHCVAAAGLETRDTADSEVCATVDHRFKSHPPP